MIKCSAEFGSHVAYPFVELNNFLGNFGSFAVLVTKSRYTCTRPTAAQATPATSSTSLWTLCQVLLGHKLRSPRCHKVQPDAAYRARRTRGQRHRASAPAHFVHSRWPRRWRKACVAEGMDGPGWLRHIDILWSCMAPVAVR